MKVEQLNSAATFFFLFCSAIGESIADYVIDNEIIQTTHGDVRGQQSLVSGRRVDVYWGIPYAKHPVRFRRPERAEPWEGVLEAITPPPSCPQVPYSGPIPLIPEATTRFDEDCLYLNIWVPRDCPVTTAGHQGLAVMVWIHGGGFDWGSTTVPTYNGQVLAATQCVLVASINYRLGPLGFLSVGNDLAPGNQGMLDQVTALDWLYNNVQHFGGSRDLMTLFGESAGALSVGALMASPLSRHLFTRAILQSGPPTATWGKQTLSDNTHIARKLAKLMKCPIDSDDAMITCLSGWKSEDLSKTVQNLTDVRSPAFGLIVDGYFLREPLNHFFSRRKIKKFKVMAGLTKNDASFLYHFVVPGEKEITSRPFMDRNAFHQTLKDAVFPGFAGLIEKKDMMAQLVEYLYINSSLPGRRCDYHSAMVRIMRDLNFLCPIYTTVAGLVDDGTVFMYSFEHRSSVTSFPEWMGVTHASELDLVFGRPLDTEGAFTEHERQLSSLMMKAWANFAKFGNPNGDTAILVAVWPPLNGDLFPYAIFDQPNDITIKHGLGHRECSFWNDVYSSLANNPHIKEENSYSVKTDREDGGATPHQLGPSQIDASKPTLDPYAPARS